jgi:hypothetical protein
LVFGYSHSAFFLKQFNAGQCRSNEVGFRTQLNLLLVTTTRTLSLVADMAVSIAIYSSLIIGLLLFILFIGCTLYLFRQYCLKRRAMLNRRKALADKKSSELAGLAHKTRADEDSKTLGQSVKLHTFDQILKQEEQSGYSVHPLKLPQPPNQSELVATSTTTAASTTSVLSRKSPTPLDIQPEQV